MPRTILPSIVQLAIKRVLDRICSVFGLPRLSTLEAQLHHQNSQLQKIEEQQRALYRVILKIRASLDLETIFRTTTKETCKLLRVERVAVYRFFADWGGEFVNDFEFSESGWGDGEKLGKNTVWNDSYLQESEGGRYRHNETLTVADIYNAGLSQCHVEVLEQFHIRAYATAPIFIGEQLWGILAAYQHSTPYEWDLLEVQFLSQVATQLGFAVKQAQLLAQAEQRATALQEANQQQEILFALVAEMRESLNLDTLFKTTVREVRKALHADRVGIFRFDPESQYNSGEFVSENILPVYHSTLGLKVIDHCFGSQFAKDYRQGRIQVVSNIYQVNIADCHLHLLEQFQIKAQIIVPLMKGKDLWGLLCVHQCSHSRDWKTTEIQFVKQLAAQFNVALEQSELLEQFRCQAHQLAQANDALEQANTMLEKLSNIDALTQVANRRFFDETLKQEWNRLRRTEDYLSLILFDIDYFKNYNDRYGHPCGDQCLIQISHAVKAVLQRSSDVLARYGGEEFAVILPNTNQSGAIKIAELIQTSIKSLKIAHANENAHNLYITVSLGIACQIPSADTSVHDLIEAADKALYKAKAEGRDRWVCASEI